MARSRGEGLRKLKQARRRLMWRDGKLTPNGSKYYQARGGIIVFNDMFIIPGDNEIFAACHITASPPEPGYSR